jgi:CRP-like cAMP-binding protein
MSSDDSSTSLLDSSVSSILGASAWNREKENRPVEGKATLLAGLGIGFGFGCSSQVSEDGLANNSTCSNNETSIHDEQKDTDMGQQSLLQRRVYPMLQMAVKSRAQHDSIISGQDPQDKKSELESSVLLDCLSTNFLFGHLPNAELEALLNHFESIKFRKNEVIMRQGDPADYFYLVYLGEVKVLRDGQEVKPDASEKYAVFGELELLTDTPRLATVKAMSTTCTLFRLARAHYQRARQQPPPTASNMQDRIQLLREALPEELVNYLEDDEMALQRLASGMSTHAFQKGDILYRKETRLATLVIIAKGKVMATEISMGGRKYENLTIGPGEPKTSFGWQSILSDTASNSSRNDDRMTGTIVAKSNGTALVITKEVFGNVLGVGTRSLQQLAAKRLARIQLQQITLFKDSALDDTQINGLLELMHHCEYSGNDAIFRAGDKIEAAMYFVREGSVTLKMNRGQDHQVIDAGGYFGETNMLLDQNKDSRKQFEFRSSMTAVTAVNTTVDILYLDECRQVVNTTLLGLGQPATVSAIDDTVQWADLTRHTLLGSGSFGQVWLASTPSQQQQQGDNPLRALALKVQAKHLLAQSPDKAERVVAEKNIMASLHSPFIIRLLNTFQDDNRLYMITSVLQGGELESIIPQGGLSERDARFYAAGILEGLSYMHRRHILHRDVKPDNTLINAKGYPVLIDLGFGT